MPSVFTRATLFSTYAHSMHIASHPRQAWAPRRMKAGALEDVSAAIIRSHEMKVIALLFRVILSRRRRI
jgi:hypothetical protein